MQTSQSSELDISDDEDLQQSFDLHSLIISSLHQEPMFTADEVISEIEGMLDVTISVINSNPKWVLSYIHTYSMDKFTL